MQRTFNGFGLDAIVPPSVLPNDLVTCEDGQTCKRCEAFVDCEGDYHHDAELRDEADLEIVTNLLNNIGEQEAEFWTENSDMYSHLADEDCHHWGEAIDRWAQDAYRDDCTDEVIELICEELDGAFDCDHHYHSSEYAAWGGGGCCLFSISIGEVETAIEINNYPELLALHNADRLDDVLDNVNCDVYISRYRKRVKVNGRYEEVGRETYRNDPNHPPQLTAYSMPGGCWHFVVDEGRMEELIDEALETISQRA